MKIVFIKANSVDTDEIPYYAAFYLGFYCLPNNAFRRHEYIKGCSAVFSCYYKSNSPCPVAHSNYRFILII